MSEQKKIEWLCARCAKRTGKTPEPDPTILRLCTECQVETWVRPYGHAGESVDPSEEEVQAAYDKQVAESKTMRAATDLIREQMREQREKEVAAAKAVVTGEEVVQHEEESKKDFAKRKKEIEELKAKLARLEAE